MPRIRMHCRETDDVHVLLLHNYFFHGDRLLSVRHTLWIPFQVMICLLEEGCSSASGSFAWKSSGKAVSAGDQGSLAKWV